GAAVQDFLQVINRRCPHIEVFLGGSRVQGEGAAEEVASMLKLFNQRDDLDLIVVTRGGGSLEDLWAFNDERLARAIVASEIPVVSAVGHEIDFTIADFVADLRAPTPSAAAELIAVSRDEWLERLDELQRRLQQGMIRYVSDRRARLDQYRTHYAFKEPVRLVDTTMQRVDELGERLQALTARKLKQSREELQRLTIFMRRLDASRVLYLKRQRLQEASGQLRLLSPQGVLDRGYSLLFDQDAKLLRSVEEVASGDELRVQLQDGRIYAKADKKSQTGLVEAKGEKARRR
ncbi:MAG: exodeoxyribonuclease VII large subunit, partial [Verrucomicrobiota bacterium]